MSELEGMNSKLLLRAQQLSKTYVSASRRITVLDHLDLEVPYRAMIAIMGASGVGKSTLLHLLGGLDRPEEGEILFENQNILRYGPSEMAEFRNRKIGFIFQMHHLLPEFNTLENTMIPFLLRTYDRKAAAARARAILAEVGLSERLDHRPGQLSGGEQQRVAVARALMLEPSLILADEPTGNLDEDTASSIFRLFRELHSRRQVSFLIATHNSDLAAICDETFLLHAGKLQKKI
jgi:ABC-type antimicrobial peptide transport system, ATPase component